MFQFCLLCLLGLALGERQPLLLLLFLALVIWMVLSDWTRLRPWLYQNASILALLILLPYQQGLDCARLIHISIYLWAGLLKCNRLFSERIFPWFVQPLRSRLPTSVFCRLVYLGPIVPWIECGIGVALLWPRFRMLGVLGAICMHGLILFCFSRWGNPNYPTITPWNLTMMLNTLVLFGFCSVSWEALLCGSVPQLGVLFVFGLLPVLGLLNRLDPIFTHGHMSGRHCWGILELSRRLVYRLPEELRKHCKQFAFGGGKTYSLDITSWYLAELRIPPPQQEALLVDLARSFAGYGARPADLELVIHRMPQIWQRESPIERWSGQKLWLDLEKNG